MFLLKKNPKNGDIKINAGVKYLGAANKFITRTIYKTEISKTNTNSGFRYFIDLKKPNKIFNKLVNDMNFKNANNKKILVFSIKEKKKDAKEKKYVGTRIHLVTPTVITFKSGNQITFNYKALVTSYKKYYENEN